ncbi:MAG: hypothetical protein M3347_16575, partial [Armatimonadota bacterium]|nr:hypothetical protein [Armatimonadota bacterium]
PGREPRLQPAPDLTEKNNPYRGLKPYGTDDKDLFFGRKRTIKRLHKWIRHEPLTVVLGPSGTGKSSLVRAGLLPRLNSGKKQRYQLLSFKGHGEEELNLRPGEHPIDALRNLLASHPSTARHCPPSPALWQTNTATLKEVIAPWCHGHPRQKLVLFVDQLEELFTMCRDRQERRRFLLLLGRALKAHPAQFRLIVTLRSDFEPRFQPYVQTRFWKDGRFFVPRMTQDELREAIEGPASAKVIYFDPPTLVDELINEVVQTPGALPLLSFTLSEMYHSYVKRAGTDRALTEEDYQKLGGVAGALRKRAKEEFERMPDAAHRDTMQRVMLRMVAIEGGESTRRRVPRSEFEYEDERENRRITEVINRLADQGARLIIGGKEPKGEEYVEPAHDELVRGWDKLASWVEEKQDDLLLQRRVTQAAIEWGRDQRAAGHLYDDNPRLPQLEQTLQSQSHWFNRLETGFIQASIHQREENTRQRERNRRNWNIFRGVFMGVLVAATAIALILLGRAKIAEAEAKSRAQTALSRQLAAQAVANLDSNLDLSLLLSHAACDVKDPDTEEARSSLLTTLQYDPDLFTYLHEQISSFTLDWSAANRNMLVVANSTNSVKLWDVGRGRLMQEKPGDNTQPITVLALSPDGKKIATGHKTGEIRVFDVGTGKTTILPHHKDDVSCLRFNAHGSLLASGAADNRVALWDLTSSAPRLKELPEQHTNSVLALAFSFDDNNLLSGDGDGNLIKWEIATRSAKQKVRLGHESAAFTSIDFSPNGQE